MELVHAVRWSMYHKVDHRHSLEYYNDIIFLKMWYGMLLGIQIYVNNDRNDLCAEKNPGSYLSNI